MAHVRQQVRAAFATRLAGVSGVQTVCHARPWNFGRSELPALQIITPAEDIRPIDDSAIETMRTITVDVLIHTLGTADFDTDADAIAAEVEALIMSATGAPWDSMITFFPSGAEFALDDVAGEKTLAVLRTRFRVQIHATDPETIGDP